MRRIDKEISAIPEKIAIIEKCKICRLGLSENNNPYVIPLNYGYTYDKEELTLYFHSAKEGKKIEIINKNNNACFEIDCDGKLIKEEKPCDYGYEFKSIIGTGKIILLETNTEKAHGLMCIIKHQTGKETEYNFTEDKLNNVCVYKMAVDKFTGKAALPPNQTHDRR